LALPRSVLKDKL